MEDPHQSQKNYFESVPAELLRDIFEYFAEDVKKSGLCQIALVCRQFLQPARELLHAQKLLVLASESLDGLTASRSLCHESHPGIQYIKELDIHGKLDVQLDSATGKESLQNVLAMNSPRLRNARVVLSGLQCEQLLSLRLASL